MATENEPGCSDVKLALKRQVRKLVDKTRESHEFDKYIKGKDQKYTHCNPHPYTGQTAEDRIEHCYKYGKGDRKFRPTLLGDQVGEYTINAKLGHGNFSTVWEASRMRGEKPETVAIKICTNSRRDSREDVNEAKTLIKLGKLTDGKGDFGKNHIIQVNEKFKASGKAGKHFCIVSEVIGPSLDLEFRTVETKANPCFDYQSSKKVIFQLMSSVAWLHKAGYAHGDIHPHNILMKEKDFRAGRNEKRELDATIADRQDLPFMPEYIVACIDEDLEHRNNLNYQNIDVRLADFGQAFRIGFPREKFKMTTPKGNRSPEWALRGTPITESIDIWAIACIAYRMVTGEHLMWVDERYIIDKVLVHKKSPSDINNDHMPKLATLIGRPPKAYEAMWKKSKIEIPEGGFASFATEGNLRDRLQREMPPHTTSDQDLAEFEAFLRRTFIWSHKKRASAIELLQDPWFNSVRTPGDDAAIQRMLATNKPLMSRLFERGMKKISALVPPKKLELEAGGSMHSCAASTSADASMDTVECVRLDREDESSPFIV